MTCTAAPHCGAARNSAKTKASSSVFVFGSFSGLVLGDSSVMVPFFEIAMRQRLNAGAFFVRLPHTGAAHSVRDSTSAERAAQERVPQQTQNLGSGARRGAGSRRLGMGIRPSRWASFLAALRARRMASAFSRVLRSDGFSYALRRFISRKTPSRCIFFLSTLRA